MTAHIQGRKRVPDRETNSHCSATVQDSAKSWRATARAGAESANALAISSGLFGILYGAACTSLGISAPLAVLSSLLVFSGAVQFAALPLLDEPLALGAIAVSTLLICNRIILMGASIAPHLATRPLLHRILALHFLTDGSWVATLAEERAIEKFPFFVGAGAWILVLWIIGTLAGTLAASALAPEMLGALRFSGVLFLGLLLLLVVEKTGMNHAPWILSASIAWIVSLILPLPLAFITGVTAGAALAFAIDRSDHG